MGTAVLKCLTSLKNFPTQGSELNLSNLSYCIPILGDSPASKFYLPTFRNILSAPPS